MGAAPIVIGVALVAIAAVGIFVYLRSRPKPEEPILNFACPHCKRKLRFKLRQAGHRGACPRCKNDFTFPFVPKGKTQS